MTQQRKRLSGPEKVAIVKRYLIDRVAISDACDERRLQPSQIERWQAAMFEHGAKLFDLKEGRRAKAAESAKAATSSQFEAVVAQKDAKGLPPRRARVSCNRSKPMTTGPQAYRHLLPQHRRHLLLPLLRARRLQPGDR